MIAVFITVVLGSSAFDDTTTGLRIAFAVVALAFGLFSWIRLPRMGLYPSRDGVRLVYPFSTRRVAWSDIAGFEPRAFGLRTMVDLVRRDGGTMRVPGIQQNSPMRDGDRRDRITDPAGYLNALLDEMRAPCPR